MILIPSKSSAIPLIISKRANMIQYPQTGRFCSPTRSPTIEAIRKSRPIINNATLSVGCKCGSNNPGIKTTINKTKLSIDTNAWSYYKGRNNENRIKAIPPTTKRANVINLLVLFIDLKVL